MSSNRALKKDKQEKLRLLTEIEEFAEANNFDFGRLYDIRIAKEVFAPELQRLESRIAECDVLLARIDKAGSCVWRLSAEIRELKKLSKSRTKRITHSFGEPYYDYISPIHYVVAQRRSHFLRRKWEIDTYLDACRQSDDLFKIIKQVPETVTSRMLYSVWARASDNH